MPNPASSYDRRISLNDPRISLYDRTHRFDEGEQLIVGGILDDAGARWREWVYRASGRHLQVEIKVISESSLKYELTVPKYARAQGCLVIADFQFVAFVGR